MTWLILCLSLSIPWPAHDGSVVESAAEAPQVGAAARAHTLGIDGKQKEGGVDELTGAMSVIELVEWLEDLSLIHI